MHMLGEPDTILCTARFWLWDIPGETRLERRDQRATRRAVLIVLYLDYGNGYMSSQLKLTKLYAAEGLILLYTKHTFHKSVLSSAGCSYLKF